MGKIIIFCQSCNKKMKVFPSEIYKKTCGNKICYSKYMSSKMIKVRNKKHTKKKCLNCKIILDLTPSMKKKYCSPECKHKWLQKNKKGIWNPKVNKRATHLGGIKTNKNNKKNGTGIYGIPKYKRQEYGKMSSINSKITNKKNKTGLFDPKVRAIGREKARKVLREKLGYSYWNILFDSMGEMEIALNICYQLNIKLKRGKNFQVDVGAKTFDFFINNCFIEFHPCPSLYNKCETRRQYFIKRRKVLNQNGYKNYNLVVIP